MMADKAFVQSYLDRLSPCSVRYAQDHTPFPKPTLLKLALTEDTRTGDARTEDVRAEDAQTSATENQTMSITIKVIKPSAQFTMPVSSSDTVRAIKERIQQERQHPVTGQRLLLKGKVLDDNKALGDYTIGSDTTLNLMIMTKST